MYKKILEFKSTEILRAAGLELPVEVEKTVVLNDGKLVFMVRFQREGASYYAAGSSFSNVDYPIESGKYEGIDITDVKVISDALAAESSDLIDAAMATAAKDVESFVKWIDSAKRVETCAQ